MQSKFIHILLYGMLCSISHGEILTSLSGSFENQFLHADGEAPAFNEFDNGSFFAPRLSLSLDVTSGENWIFHATGRIDRGFDAGNEENGEARIDEVLLRYRSPNNVNIQIGQTATVFGAWSANHDFYDSAFLTPPLPYGEIRGINVLSTQSLSPTAIQGRSTGALPSIYDGDRTAWAASIWGPAYTAGISVFSNIGKFDYAFEFKNVSSGISPEQWDFDIQEFEEPTFSGRIGYRFSPAWNLGVSFSRGPYLEEDAFIADGFDRGDLINYKSGIDLKWEHRKWSILAEVIYDRYETLEVGTLESLNYYIQARYKIAPGLWFAGRISQAFNSNADLPSGESVPFSPDLTRAEAAIGFRLTPDVLLKMQYTYTASNGQLEGPAENFFNFGVGWKF